MAVDTRADALKLVREIDGLEVDLHPLQGLWTENLYLKLTDQTNHLVEFTDGMLVVLPIPADRHQVILAFVYELLLAFIRPLGGKVLFAPLRLRLAPGKFREPDILLVRDAHDARRQNRYWLGADLVVEIVSSDDPERDTVVKRADYAGADIPEYWIIDPEDETVAALTLTGEVYSEHGVFHRGMVANSVVLDGFSVIMDDVFDAQ